MQQNPLFRKRPCPSFLSRRIPALFQNRSDAHALRHQGSDSAASYPGAGLPDPWHAALQQPDRSPLRSQAVFPVSDTDPLPHILPDSFLRYKCAADKHSHPPYAELPADTDSDSVPPAVPVLHTLSADCLCLLFLFCILRYIFLLSLFSAANSSSSPPAHNNRKAQNTRPVKRRAVSVLPALYNFAKIHLLFGCFEFGIRRYSFLFQPFLIILCFILWHLHGHFCFHTLKCILSNLGSFQFSCLKGNT